jgi:hypothetical protein
VAALRGARLIPQQRALPGPNPSIYVPLQNIPIDLQSLKLIDFHLLLRGPNRPMS